MPIQIKAEPRDESDSSAVVACSNTPSGDSSSNNNSNNNNNNNNASSSSGGGSIGGSVSSLSTQLQQPSQNANSRLAAPVNHQRSSSNVLSSRSPSNTSSYANPAAAVAASHTQSLASTKSSDKLSEEAMEALEKRIDISSIKGVFGWTTIDGINIPFIFREDKKFVSVRIVEVKLFSRYPNSFPDELGKRDPLTSYFITEHEAKLLNEINTVHCSYEYGKQLFTTQDLIVNMAEFEQFHDIVKKSFPTEDQQEDTRAHDMSLPRKSDRPQFMDYCGWLQINNTITPYVERSNGGKYVPLSVIRYAAGLLADNQITGEPPTKIECDMLNETCKVAGFNFSFCKSTKLVSLNTIKTYHNPLIIDLPQDKPLTHARYIDFSGNPTKNSNFSSPPPPHLSAFPSHISVSSALSSTQAMHPFNTALPPYPRNPSPRGNPTRSPMTNNLINPNIVIPSGLNPNFLNFAKQQLPLKVPSSNEQQSLQQQQRANFSTSNSLLGNSRLQSEQANPNQHGLPNPSQLPTSKQHNPLHVLKSFLTKGHVVTQSLPSIVSQATGGQSVIHQRSAHQASQNILVSQLPRLPSPSISNPANMYASSGPILSALSQHQSQAWNAVVSSLPGNYANIARYTQANSSVRMPVSSASYPHPISNIPVTTAPSLPQGHHPPSIYEQLLSIPDTQSTAVAGLWTRPNEASSASQAVAAHSTVPSPNMVVSSSVNKSHSRTLASNIQNIASAAAASGSGSSNHNSISANSMVLHASSVQPINLTSSSPVPTTNKVSQQPSSSQQPQQQQSSSQQASAAEQISYSLSSTPTATGSVQGDSQPQQPVSKPMDSALVQHISSIFLRGKSISCINSPNRSGSYALVEAVCKLYYPQCSMNEFLFALENVLKVPLTTCTDEEEKAFIQYYSLPVSVLKCNKIIKLGTLESHFPQLTYMFCKGQDTASVSSNSASDTVQQTPTVDTEKVQSDSLNSLPSNPNSLTTTTTTTTATSSTPLSAASGTTTSSPSSSTPLPVIAENDGNDVVLDCSTKSSVVVITATDGSPVPGSSNGPKDSTLSTSPKTSSSYSQSSVVSSTSPSTAAASSTAALSPSSSSSTAAAASPPRAPPTLTPTLVTTAATVTNSSAVASDRAKSGNPVNNSGDSSYVTAVPLISLADVQKLSEPQLNSILSHPSLKRPGNPLASGPTKSPCRSLEETVQRLHQTQSSPLANTASVQICQTDSGK
ncbi:Hypothetical predicted protein [Octopus vulgaris]|uniref:Mucin-5AC n=1 Tax=Octopus vulgaris TaxID=6645 RepID=A0AA36AK07_OCTVU|nr:Hypothetical predicted protein [Octopus vulgaris]